MIQLKRLSVLALALSWYGAFGQIQWSTIADSDSFRVTKGVAIGVSNRGYVLTGDTGQIGFVKFWDRVWQFDPASNTWAQKKRFDGQPRVSASSFVIGNRGYVCLGMNDSIIWDSIFSVGPGGTIYRNIPIKVWKGRPMNDLWEYDPATDSWAKKADFPGARRAAASAFVIAGKAYVGLGVSETGSMLRDFYEYDPAANSWRRVADFPGTERSNASAFSAMVTTGTPQTYGFVGSGRDAVPNRYFNDWYRYDATANSWTRIRDLPAERPQQDAASFGFGYLGYVTTGFNWFFHRLTWQYNANSNVWITENPFPAPAFVRSSTVYWQLNNRCFVGAGNADTVPSFKDYRRFNIDTSDIRITQFPDTICTGVNFQVKFRATQSTYAPGNTFRVQLSDRFGEFNNLLPAATIIGTLASVADSGTINCFINPNANPRISFTDTNDYRIRIVSSNIFKFGSAITQTMVVLPKVIVDGVLLASGDTACVGADATMRVRGTWSGERPNFRIQWRKGNVALVNDGVKIFGANDTVLRIVNIANSDAGLYSVIVTGDCSGDTSQAIRLSVVNVGRPTITLQPRNTITCEGGSANFNMTATGRSLNYQWFRATTRDTAGRWLYDTLRSTFFINGVNSNNLRITSAFLADTGRYFAKVFEACGTYRYTDTVSLTFSRQVQVTDIFPRDTFLLENNPVTFRVFALGDSLRYRWKFEDRYLSDNSRISGSQTNALTINSVDFQDLGFYSCEVDGLCGDTLSPLCLLDVGIVPKFRSHPRDTSRLCVGEFLELSVIADGVNLSYRWLKNGVPVINSGTISGATERVLKISSVAVADNGAYRCEVSAGNAMVTSNLGQVIVSPIPGKPGINQLGITILECTIAGGDNYQWFINNIFQPQFRTQQIVTSIEGEYKVRVIKNNCVGAFSDPYLFFNTSVKIPEDVAKISLFPNPNNGKFTLEIEAKQALESISFELRDLSGRLIRQAQNLQPGRNEIDANGIAQGLYIGRVLVDNASYDIKVRIQ